MNVNEDLKYCEMQKIGGGGGLGRGCRVGWSMLVSEVFVKIQKKNSGGGSSRWVGQCGCERRSEVFVKIQNKKKSEKIGGGGSGRGGWGVRVDLNEELKFL